MAQTNITIRMDNADKTEFSQICKSIGLSVNAAFNVFAKKVISDRKIPFELNVKDDDFYSEANIRNLEKIKKLYDEGKLKFVTKTMEELRAMEK